MGDTLSESLMWPLYITTNPNRVVVSAVAAYFVSGMTLPWQAQSLGNFLQGYLGGAAASYLQGPNTPPRNFGYSDFSGCQTLPMPGPKDCKGLLNYLSAGEPSIEARGDMAMNLLGNADFWNTCSMAEIKELESNVYAFSFADLGLPGPWAIGVNDVVTINQSNSMTNADYCSLAKMITTTPLNDCQAANYNQQYMANETAQTRATLNTWLSYCK